MEVDYNMLVQNHVNYNMLSNIFCFIFFDKFIKKFIAANIHANWLHIYNEYEQVLFLQILVVAIWISHLFLHFTTILHVNFSNFASKIQKNTKIHMTMFKFSKFSFQKFIPMNKGCEKRFQKFLPKPQFKNSRLVI
jgi:hypothetical protein